MGRFDEEGPVPARYVTRLRYAESRQREMRDAAEQVHKAEDAAPSKRRRWWPFGRRRDR